MKGKEGWLALGSYPAVSLGQARIARDQARLEQKKGMNPVQLRKAEKLKASNSNGETFEAVAGDWYKKQLPIWSLSHAKRMRDRSKALEAYRWQLGFVQEQSGIGNNVASDQNCT